MKKLFFFAVAALSLAACTSEELNVKEAQQAVQDNAAVNFDVYVNRGLTRAGTPNDIKNENIGQIGFGVFAYYTNDTQYSSSATPNFMYNQKVVTSDNPATETSVWTYEPVKYWPNEYGEAAISDEIDYVSFFSYAPWTEVEPTTGKPKATNADEENYNIVGVTKNNATGDPIVKYVVDTNPKTSVDLLWGVKATGSTETSIAGETTVPSPAVGMPFVDLTKPAKPADGKIRFNLKHALAKVKVTIDYIDDAETPAGPAAKKLNADETRIYVRWLEINGFALKGALNLNNDEANKPNWKDIEGLKELEFPETTRFNDGRKDAKEGTQNGAANNELNIRLNPEIVENFTSTAEKMDNTDPDNPVGTGKIIFGADKKPGVTATPQLVFGGDESVNGGYFYVIPRAQGEPVDVRINYDVLTLDPSLATTLSGTKDFGSEIENQIEKLDIFDGKDFEPGMVYTIKIHLGMTSVKFEATVEPWVEATNGQPNVDLPDNQPADDQQGGGVTPGGDTPGGDTPGGDTPTPAPAATVAEALAATPAITSFTYTLVGGSDADLTGTLTTETTEYANTSNPSLNGTYYKFMRSSGTNYVWVRGDAAIDGTTANTILGQNATSVSGWTLKLAPKE